MEAAKGFRHRDDLLAIQAKAQEKWNKEKIFEVNAPEGGDPLPEGKFFGNFPYPYMNGVLHLGHAFSVSKLEFAAAYQRLIGKRVLFPQGFHCTGMPIKACADRLKGEIEEYGLPPVFPDEEPAEQDQAEAAASDVKVTKKGKAAAKKGKGATQWDILKNSGIPEDEIHNFQDPMHWLRYFPPVAQADLSFLGCGIDWRRSFITTDANPYYDSFVRWQMTTLKALGKVVKAKRFAVYSPKDGQPCADHDRASGEGVGSQEYTLVKMKALELRGPLADLEKVSPGCEVSLMAATLRPETMCGQTNCWVLPEGDYVAVQGPGKAVYVLCERAARNLAFQEQLPVEGEYTVLARCKGQDLIGTPLRAPNCPHERIYVLPLLTILMTKGTGVVTSVPSDSPTDYMALQDLKKKAKLREKFGVEDDWVMPYEVIPIIDIPDFGDKAAVKVCEDLKIQSQNDTVKLEEAKGMVYLKGFNEGVMTAGRYAGDRVADAKPKMRQDLLDSGDGIKYAEPERRVMSRSGDECIVALTDQWSLTYGEPEWRAKTEQALADMETHDPVVQHAFEHTLGWLEHWACSRSFGLGTKIPWDTEFLVESLSDSTIYMAYYTVAHILQEGDMFGDHRGAVKPEAMTHEVWDAIFLGKPVPEGCAIPLDVMHRMKDEFKFWYPFDLRVSGKDLIQNHLTFCLYNHTAIFPQELWPRSFRTNGHLMLNSEKMSKNTGNFKTLRAAIDQYSADATRVALADASDANDDGNFEEVTANAAIVRLANELAWFHEIRAASASLRTGDLNLADKVFANAISCAAHAARAAYDGLLFRDALKAAMYDMQNARGAYRLQLGADGMHAQVTEMFLDASVRMLAPICPHWCEHVWGEVLGREGSVLVAGWPEVPQPDFVLKMAAEYIEKLVTHLRGAIAKKEAPPKKKKADTPPPPKVTGVELHVAECFEGWRAEALRAAREAFDRNGGKLPDNWIATAVDAAAATEELAGLNEKTVKSTTMPFLKAKGAEAAEGGRQALDDTAPFDEFQVLTDYIPHLQRSLGMDNVQVRRHPQGAPIDSKEGPFPLQPKIVLLTD